MVSKNQIKLITSLQQKNIEKYTNFSLLKVKSNRRIT